MQVQVHELRPYLQSFDLRNLLVEGLGWNHYRAEAVRVHLDGHDHVLEPVAEKAGFVVYLCGSGADGSVPAYPVRRKIENQIAKLAYEHLIIFVDAGQTLQVWQWVKREAGKPAACREQTYYAGQSGEALLQRLQPLFVSLDEEPSLNIALVASRVRAALDVEKVTKRFYERFKAELTTFGNFIEGITTQGDRDWYASLMLNRMMFVYFVQKQGFLDDDLDYLRNKLDQVRRERGEGEFQLFYYEFLRRLFHDGLGQPEAQRAPDLAALLGKVPFLNGGLFDVHDLERDNPNIAIPDEAFERVFNFFDGYRWHLDERPYREDNEINPDVLGYIFEKYVNQKQMGAYYTKEDITGYISRNTVIPFLFDAAKKECPIAFGPDGGVWRLLQDDPDRYIYPAVGHGITWNARQTEAPEPLAAPYELPDEIAAGIHDVSKRGGWNRPAPEDYALPTESWREVVARRTRYHEVRSKLAAGEISEINDLITLNLDIERFARDVVAQSEGPELLRAFWHTLYGNQERSDTGISVLDPTCGSGAFLFAALNILEPLYTACLEGMRGFLDDLERSERPHSPNALSDFRDVLAQVEGHPSERYFILKSIVLNNLYGVDIMEEAVEICKLRLFLKLVAQLESYDQIEPLPDIDFNIRAGNTLVGFTSQDAVRRAMTITETSERPRPEVRRTVRGQQIRALDQEQRKTLERIEEDAEVASRAFDMFREQQTTLGGEITGEHKADLRSRLDSLREELDRYLAAEYGVDPKKAVAYDAWRASHQPFHWFVEFYGIMSKGGFDVIIGNPPYVEYSKVRKEYQVRGFETERCGNLYAFVLERSGSVGGARLGLIIPISFVSTQRMEPARQFSASVYGNIHISNYADRPSSLFDGVHQKLSILLCSRGRGGLHTTGFRRAYSKEGERDSLFATTSYHAAIPDHGMIRKYRMPTEDAIRSKVDRLETSLATEFTSKPNGARPFHLNHRLMMWVKCFLSAKKSKEFRTYYPVLHTSSAQLSALFNSSLFFWHWETLGDCWHLVNGDIVDFKADLLSMSEDDRQSLEQLGTRLEADLEDKKRYIGSVQTDYEYYHRLSKPIIDEIDRVLAKHYGFTEEELDFIINYDIKYRLGREG